MPAEWVIAETRPGVFVGELRSDDGRLFTALGGDSRLAVEQAIQARADYLKRNPHLVSAEERPPVTLKVVD